MRSAWLQVGRSAERSLRSPGVLAREMSPGAAPAFRGRPGPGSGAVGPAGAGVDRGNQAWRVRYANADGKGRTVSVFVTEHQARTFAADLPTKRATGPLPDPAAGKVT